MKTSPSAFTYFLLASFIATLFSCYRMPTENDFSVVPTTNNPAVTNEKTESLLPGMGY
ncbi:hypothetical protein [Candidatus Protochlamydia phocaeensis]|uniref:hypothetical protein n=1 Tax=Candidatus Protochlamydia phocaeensis TaxID=1414722 RepID=UPI000AEFC1C0|nr:hypothetical protein [Candidatus Protochlamydia phocaeensis]